MDINNRGMYLKLFLQYFVIPILWLSVVISAYAIDIPSANWLEKKFPTMTNCTPNSFYYDTKGNLSNDNVLEARGIKPYKIDEYLAYYQVDDIFYDLKVRELAIPSGTTSLYTITVSAGAHMLQSKIYKKTGINLEIYKKGFKAKSGTPYLIAINDKKSTFACFTFEE